MHPLHHQRSSQTPRPSLSPQTNSVWRFPWLDHRNFNRFSVFLPRLCSELFIEVNHSVRHICHPGRPLFPMLSKPFKLQIWMSNYSRLIVGSVVRHNWVRCCFPLSRAAFRLSFRKFLISSYWFRVSLSIFTSPVCFFFVSTWILGRSFFICCLIVVLRVLAARLEFPLKSSSHRSFLPHLLIHYIILIVKRPCTSVDRFLLRSSRILIFYMFIDYIFNAHTTRAW